MQHVKVLRAGILFVALPLLVISCAGERNPTEPTQLTSEITAVPVYDAFYDPVPILTVAREVLVDSRATQIEWDVAGNNYVLVSGRGGGGGGEYYANVRAEWTRDVFEAPVALQLMVQWPDLTENRLDHPIVNDSIDVYDDDGNRLFECETDDRVIRPRSWHRANDLEDQIFIEIFNAVAHPPTRFGEDTTWTFEYPADGWRWGAGTTDPATPVSVVDFPGVDSDSIGATSHPQAGFLEDRYDVGLGPVSDPPRLSYEANYTSHPDGVVPRMVASKGTRDSRLNRSKPILYTVWRNVAQPLLRCTTENPIRLDDAAQRDKTWNPGDYVPGWIIGFPVPDSSRALNVSSADVIGRGAWIEGKWSIEVRRRLNTGWSDDIVLVPGRTYGIRLTIRDGQSRRESRSAILPLALQPAPTR
jgi:hypothetical protein